MNRVVLLYVVVFVVIGILVKITNKEILEYNEKILEFNTQFKEQCIKFGGKTYQTKRYSKLICIDGSVIEIE